MSASKGKIDLLECAQNKALRVIIETRPRLQQQCKILLPTTHLFNIEIKKQAVGVYIKMQVSHIAEQLQDHQFSFLKTQISTGKVCHKTLEKFKANIPMETNKRLTLDYTEIENKLTILEKEIPEVILRATSLCMINGHYP